MSRWYLTNDNESINGISTYEKDMDDTYTVGAGTTLSDTVPAQAAGRQSFTFATITAPYYGASLNWPTTNGVSFSVDIPANGADITFTTTWSRQNSTLTGANDSGQITANNSGTGIITGNFGWAPNDGAGRANTDRLTFGIETSNSNMMTNEDFSLRVDDLDSWFEQDQFVSPVTSITGSATGNNELTLSWTSMTGATNYELQRATDGGFSSPTTRYSGTATSFVDSVSLADGTPYFYRVRWTHPNGIVSEWASPSQAVWTLFSLPFVETFAPYGWFSVPWWTLSTSTPGTASIGFNNDSGGRIYSPNSTASGASRAVRAHLETPVPVDQGILVQWSTNTAHFANELTIVLRGDGAWWSDIAGPDWIYPYRGVVLFQNGEGGANSYHMRDCTNGSGSLVNLTATGGITQPTFTVEPNTYNTRLEVFGTNVRWKTWLASSAEPSGWFTGTLQNATATGTFQIAAYLSDTTHTEKFEISRIEYYPVLVPSTISRTVAFGTPTVEAPSIYVGTSTAATATAYNDNQRKIDRCQNGMLWSMFWNGQSGTTGSPMTFSRSSDNGATWISSGGFAFAGVSATYLPSASFFIDLDDYAHVAYKDRSTGYLNYRRGTPNAGRTAWTWSSPTELFNTNEPDVPDIVVHREGTGWAAHVVYSSTPGQSTAVKAYYRRVDIASNGSLTLGSTVTLSTALVSGNSNSGFPSIDFNHTGDAKTVAGSTPHLYVAWSSGAIGTDSGIRFRKAVYSGGSWTWNTEREIDTGYFNSGTNQFLNCMFDGTRVVMAGMLYDNTNFPTIIRDRDAADTTTTAQLTEPNLGTSGYPEFAGGSATYDAQGNVHFIGRNNNTGSNILTYGKWVRGGALSTSTLGSVTDTPYASFKRGYSDGALEYVYTDGASSPYTIKYGVVAGNVVSAATISRTVSLAGHTVTIPATHTATVVSSTVALGTVTIVAPAATAPATLSRTVAFGSHTVVAPQGVPPEVTNLQANAISATQVDLTWDNMGTYVYDIERNSSVIVTGHNTNSYSDSTVVASTLYNYRVRAVKV